MATPKKIRDIKSYDVFKKVFFLFNRENIALIFSEIFAINGIIPIDFLVFFTLVIFAILFAILFTILFAILFAILFGSF